MRKHYLSFFHITGFSMIGLSIILGFIYTLKGQDAFMEYLKEDGVIENLTALFLLSSSALAIWKVTRLSGKGRWIPFLTWISVALLFFFAAGEEISWGQRIFNFKTTGFFESNNLQHETNLHNLVIGGVKINKLVFSQLLMVMLIIYFVFLPFLSRRLNFFGHLVRFFDLPVPRLQHVIALAVSIGLISFFPYLRSGELNEFAFSVIMFLVFLHPANPDMLQTGTSKFQ